jgi:hypothetical protein
VKNTIDIKEFNKNILNIKCNYNNKAVIIHNLVQESAYVMSNNIPYDKIIY